MSTTQARQNGSLITLCEGDGLPWMLVCETHDGYCCEFETKTEAIRFRSSPIDWCEQCASEARPVNVTDEAWASLQWEKD